MFEQFRSLFNGVALGPSQSLPLGFTTKPVGTPFKKTLTYHDFSGIADGDVTVTAGTYGTIGTYTVSAQRYATFGQGTIAQDPMNQGKIFIDTEDTTGADIDGWIRLVLANANETSTRVVLEERTEKLSENPTDITKWIRLPEYPLKVSEDSKLIIQFKADGSGTKVVDSGETTIYIDVTEYQ